MSTTVAPGDVLAGKYRVERIIGKGGMGMVVAAVNLGLDKRVALKFLLPEVAQNPELVARFDREARAASRIESEHVAKVLDVGKLETGAPFMVMEYLEGSDLAQFVKARGALPGSDAIEFVLQACEALAEAHVAGIVHRDLKPANLFLTSRADGSPSIKVLDFGISKIALASDQGQGMTQTSALMGSPNYMAPEQLRSARNVDARTDIWSLGIILHELLTGDVAFKAETVPELYVSILQSPPIPLRSRRPDAPPAMEAIVTRCLEKDPARRFANVGELATALGELAPPRARLSIDRITRIVGGSARPQSVAQLTVPMGAPGTPLPAYAPGPPAPSYALNPIGVVTPPGNYGPSPHATPPTPAPMVAPPMPPQQYAPQAQGYPVTRPQQGMAPATVALIIIVALFVIGGGGCMTCLCIGAAQSQSSRRARSEMRPVELCATERAEASLDVSSLLGPFQRPAGWTTVSRSARSRPPSARWDPAVDQPAAGQRAGVHQVDQADVPRLRRARRATRGAGHGHDTGSAR